METLADLIRVLFSLVGDFWFVFLFYLVAKLFGAMRQKGTSQRSPRRTAIPAGPVLTPVAGGGTWPSQAGRSMKQEKAAPERMSAHEGGAADDQSSVPLVTLDYLSAADTPPVSDSGLGMAIGAEPSATSRLSSLPAPDAREGMKWALIFSPPRAKQPYKRPGMPPHARQS